MPPPGGLTPTAGAGTTRDDVPPSHIGKYEVQRRLGAGGMGSLYLARDPGLDRLVAIKVLKDEYQDDPELRERFIREARSVARLRHENIIIVFDIGEADGLPFMAMEYIAGETVAQLMRRSPTPPLIKRLMLVESLCAGLAHAHSAQIIHRDIKPANLMITGDGVLKILDFGIARLADSGMTQGGMMLGTVNYMSPEQVAGPTVDHRSDIFATGAVLYELITLEQAFPGRIDSGVLNKILYEGATPIEERVPSIDRGLASIVGRALQRDPEDRFQHASEMGVELTRVRRRLAEAPPPDLDVQQGTTVADRPRPPSSAKKSESAGRKVLSDERFAELQRQQVEEHLRFGEAALAKGDHDGALHYGERAAMVDPESRPAIDLINRARFAIESKAVRALLTAARRQLADGLIDEAAALVNQADASVPNLDGADELRAEVGRLFEEIAELRERERRISSSLERARVSIEQGGYETALRALYEVLALDPDRTEARQLEQAAISHLQAQREHQRARRQAHDRLAAARQLAEQGRYDEALAAIDSVDGPSDTVRTAAVSAAAEVRAQQRRSQVAAIIADARRAFQQGEFDQAGSIIDSIPQEDLTREARELRADIDRTLRERLELERKQRAVDDGLRVVAALVERSDLTGASTKLDEIERIGLPDPQIKDRRAQLTALIAAEQARRRQEARDRLAAKVVDAARQLLENGDGHAAIALLERDTSGHALVSEALRDVRATVAEEEARARREAERRRQEEEARRRAEAEAAQKREEARLAEERRKQEEERRAREAEVARRRDEFATLVIAAERAISEADPEQATVLLQRADRVGRVEDSGLASRAAAARAELDRLERERVEEARRAEAEAARKREEARLAEERKKQEEARRAREAEIARRRDEFATLVVAAERALSEADPEQATVLLQRADQVGQVEDSTLASRAAAARAELERLDREREEQARRESEARRLAEEAQRKEAWVVDRLARARDTADHEAALELLKEAHDLLPGDPRVEALATERRASLDAERAEAARLAEEARKREAEEREREAAVTRVLSRERQEDPEAALTMLREALTLVPGDQRVQARIAQRNADLERERAEAERQRLEAERQRQIAVAVSAVAAALEQNDLDSAERLLAEGEQQFAAAPFLEVRRAYDGRRREEARARKEAEDAERRRLAREEKEARERRAREEKEAREREAREKREHARQEKEEAARRRREERAARQAASGQPAGTRPAWTRYAAAAGVALLIGVGAWAIWPRSEAEQPSPTPTGEDRPRAGNDVPPGPTPTPSDNAPRPPAPGPEPEGRRPTPQQPQPGETAAQRAAREQAAREEAARAQAARDEAARGQAARDQAARDQAVRDQAVRDQAARDQAVRDQAARDQAARDQAARDQAARDQAAREQAAREQAERERLAAAAQAKERAAIQQLLTAYVEAYNALDEPRLRQLVAGFRGIPGRPLIKSVTVTLSSLRIDVSPDLLTATVTGTQNFEYEWNRAGADRKATGQLNWRLRKSGGVWSVLP